MPISKKQNSLSDSSGKIVIRGARQHNLKNVDLDLPRNKLIVMTGLSGSGKSSLAFDTIYAEGQRRYVESLSAYARQFLGQKNKPDVDSIEGLQPAVAIDQKIQVAFAACVRGLQHRGVSLPRIGRDYELRFAENAVAVFYLDTQLYGGAVEPPRAD